MLTISIDENNEYAPKLNGPRSLLPVVPLITLFFTVASPQRPLQNNALVSFAASSAEFY